MRNRFLLALCLALGGCTCNQKKTSGPAPDFGSLLAKLPKAQVFRAVELIPDRLTGEQAAGKAWVVAAPDAKASYDALLASDLGGALVQGGAMEDLTLSEQMESIFSITHDLAATSAQPFAADKLAEMLVGPAAVAVETAKKPRFLAVKEIDSSQEPLVRLALMAASIKEGANAKTQDHDGQKITTLQQRAQWLWVSAFQNVVLISDDRELMEQSVDLALGKAKQAPSPVQELSAGIEKPDLAVFARLDSQGLFRALADVDHVVLHVGFAPGRVEVKGALTRAASQVASVHAATTVPKDVLAFAALGSASVDRFLERLAHSEAKEPGDVGRALRVPGSLSSGSTDEAFYAAAGIRDGALLHLVGWGVKEPEKIEKLLPNLAKAWTGSVQAKPLPSGGTAHCSNSDSLCLAVSKGFLLAATDFDTLSRAVETGEGKRPALTDVPGFTQVFKDGESKYLSIYVNTPAASDAALAFFEDVGRKSNQGFDPGDVEETIAPLSKAFRTLPAFGGKVDANGVKLAGELKALPAQ